MYEWDRSKREMLHPCFRRRRLHTTRAVSGDPLGSVDEILEGIKDTGDLRLCSLLVVCGSRTAYDCPKAIGSPCMRTSRSILTLLHIHDAIEATTSTLA